MILVRKKLNDITIEKAVKVKIKKRYKLQMIQVKPEKNGSKIVKL